MSSAKKKVKQKEKYNYKEAFTHYLYCLVIISLLAVAGANLNKYLQTQKVLGTSIDISPLKNELSYWKNISEKNPTFVDSYLELAKIYTEMGDKNEALNQIKIALTLDPNSSKIIEVQHELSL